MSEGTKPNTVDHELLLSDMAKSMTEGLLQLSSIVMDSVVKDFDKDTTHPAALEQRVKMAERMSDMAVKMHTLGESARIIAKGLSWDRKND